jgi:hypothetical protein
MSNVKEVFITGKIAFNATRPEQPAGIPSQEVKNLLASLNMPTWGLRIQYKPENAVGIPNWFGGRTLFIDFTISGSEAESWDALFNDIKTLNEVAVIYAANARELRVCESPSTWTDLTRGRKQDKAWQIELLQHRAVGDLNGTR